MSEILNINRLKNLPESQYPLAFNELQVLLKTEKKRVVILDDDPTGCQTVHDVPVLTDWSESLLQEMLASGSHCFFILTNSRSMVEAEAVKLTQNIVSRVQQWATAARVEVIFISRSDSTLRGHYPAEPDAIAAALDQKDAMHCLIPAFFPGGRFTLQDTHYVQEKDQLIPAHLTPFAQDKSFGFFHAHLPKYVEEKTGGRYKSENVLSISLEDIRQGGPNQVEQKLLQSKSHVCVVNAAHQNDLDIFALAAWGSIHKGKHLIFRTAASFINSFCRIESQPLLNQKTLNLTAGRGALFVVGSYVAKSSQQLQHLLENTSIHAYKLPVEKIISKESKTLMEETLQAITEMILAGKHVVIYTSRTLITGESAADNLDIGRQVSEFLVAISKAVYEQASPALLLSKGGITSHVIARDALQIKKANVKGQILPGVPVWDFIKPNGSTGQLVIFPGNVGDETSLTQIYKLLPQ